MRALLLLLVPFVCALFAHEATSSDVIELNSANFNSTIAKYDILLVSFCMDVYYFCIELKPEYDAAATALLAAKPPIHIARIDCLMENELCTQHDSFDPSIQLFKNGTFDSLYLGARLTKYIVEYMKHEASYNVVQ